MFGLETVLRIPRSFDPERLRADLAQAESYADAALPDGYHNGGWRALSLVSPSGRVDDVARGEGPYRETELLARCPYLAEVVASFSSPKLLVRLMTLLPGGRVHEHYDPDAGFDRGIVRIHVPIVTHPRARLVIAGRARHFRAGEAWYADFTFPHYVENKSDVRRVHLVLELVVDDAVRALLPRSYVGSSRLRGILRTILCKGSDLAGWARSRVGALAGRLSAPKRARLQRLLGRPDPG